MMRFMTMRRVSFLGSSLSPSRPISSRVRGGSSLELDVRDRLHLFTPQGDLVVDDMGASHCQLRAFV